MESIRYYYCVNCGNLGNFGFERIKNQKCDECQSPDYLAPLDEEDYLSNPKYVINKGVKNESN